MCIETHVERDLKNTHTHTRTEHTQEITTDKSESTNPTSREHIQK